MSGAAEGSVRAVRTYLRSHGRAPATVLDRYVSLFALAMLLAVLGQPLSTMLGGLAGPVDPARAGAGVALIALALAGFLAAARAAGPVLLPAADASWLLLSPLNRRRLLARGGRALLVIAVVAGVLLGLGALAVLGAPDQLVWRLLGALVLGVSVSVAGMALAVLAQGSPSWQVWVTAATVALLVLAVVAVSGQARTVLAAAASVPLPSLAAAASGAVVVSGLLVRQAWASLSRIPTRTLLGSSTRAGHVATAAVSLDPGALTWIAEDNHWRARTLTSRRWPSLPAPLALAWQDWRRLARRPGRLAGVFGAVALPAVLAQAGAAPAVVGVMVLAGAMVAAAMGVSGTRRDGDNPALARLIGVGRRPALAARALLPVVLSGTWATLALAGLGALAAFGAVAPISGMPSAGVPAGALGAGWWLFGLLVAPALAAGALRMAERSPVDHSMPVIDTPGGSIPTGPVIWAATGVDLAVLGCLPALAALLSPPSAVGGLLMAQAVSGVLVLAGYVWRGRRKRAT
ncbi:hypothetical protein FH608_009580 [Nonomuraea phyllanthi]|uniref:Uncharacterized protein n=1 Tax=Nonomuraea phyllanthi TaxID=2219224 RepID=A0A5C4WQ25_9ACTN|nr:DUF6297 family protein [Nonomuraea phyllanthi]KAB8195753.1 hypothetical protein FH608_009580 [Nonomuraea phyllanthi]